MSHFMTAQTRRTRGAYTLVELLIVVAVLGLAGALLVPTIGQPDSFKAQAVVRRIIGDLSFAQSDALAQQEPRRVHFYDDNRGYVILRSPYDPEADYIQDPMARAGIDGAYIVDFTAEQQFDGISISAVAMDGEEWFVTYDELGGTITDGGGPGTGGYIEVSSADATYRIHVAPFTGKLTVEEIVEE